MLVLLILQNLLISQVKNGIYPQSLKLFTVGRILYSRIPNLGHDGDYNGSEGSFIMCSNFLMREDWSVTIDDYHDGGTITKPTPEEFK
jgi:hypothetical protein